MFIFEKNLMKGSSLKRPALVKWRLEHRVGQPGVYVITRPLGDGQLDIYHSNILMQRAYRKLDIRVVGLCASYDEAVEMISRAAVDMYRETGEVDFKKL